MQGEIKGGGETNEFIKDGNKRKDYKWRAVSSDFNFLLKENSKSRAETRKEMARMKGLGHTVKF